MDELIEPPVPPEADLRDFAFMPLEVSRLRDSGMAVYASAEEFRAAVILWCTAWHQVPAASLPDDDRVLAAFAGFGRGPSALQDWMAVREGALRGFCKASDGRLYHLVVAEKACEAWKRKLIATENRAKTSEKVRAWREQKKLSKGQKYLNGDTEGTVFDGNRNRNEDVTGYTTGYVTEVCNDRVTSLTGIGTGTGTGTGKYKKEEDSTNTPAAVGAAKRFEYPEAFEDWWTVYPRRIGKLAAFRAWEKAKRLIGGGNEAELRLIDSCRKLKVSVAGKDLQYIAHPATWLNEGRWDDQPSDNARSGPSGRSQFGLGG